MGALTRKPLAIDQPGLAFWARADRGVTLNSTTVVSWADSSGLTAGYGQATAAKQPVFNATGAPNGNPCITFDGVNDGLSGSIGKTFTNLLTTYIVCRCVTFISNGDLWVTGGAFSLATYDITNSGSKTRLHANAGFIAEIAHPGVGVWFVQRVQFDGVNGTLGQGGVTGSGAFSSNSVMATQWLGGDNGFDIACNYDVAEVLIYNASHSAAQRAEISAYFGGRYGLTVT